MPLKNDTLSLANTFSLKLIENIGQHGENDSVGVALAEQVRSDEARPLSTVQHRSAWLSTHANAKVWDGKVTDRNPYKLLSIQFPSSHSLHPIGVSLIKSVDEGWAGR